MTISKNTYVVDAVFTATSNVSVIVNKTYRWDMRRYEECDLI